jgi:uncharacterized membrane protein
VPGSHSHHHSAGHESPPVVVAERARWVLLTALALAAAITVLGLVKLWPEHSPRPDSSSTAFAAPGVTFPHAKVTAVQPACKTSPQSGLDPSGDPNAYLRQGGNPSAKPTCGQITVQVSSSAQREKSATIPVAPEVSRSGLSRGDSVQLMRTPAGEGAPSQLSYLSVDRLTPIWILTAVFVLVVAMVARLRGLLALVGLGVGALVLVKFMLPALLTGESGLAVALVGSAAIMFVVLYLTHGVSLRTSAALAGTLVGVVIIAFTGVIAVKSSRLTGITDEGGAILSSFIGDVSFQGLLTCAVIVAGLGVLNDVTITQASAVWELRGAAPDLSRRTLFTSGMRIGRDHIASTIYTIVFAYAGTALSVLLLLFIYDRPILDVLSTEDIAEEVTRTLASAIGLVLAMPATTAIAVAVVAPRPRRERTSIL